MKKSIKKFTAILLALIMGLSFTYTSYPVYAQENIQPTGATSEQTENSVAKVGDTYYDDLAEALYSAAETGATCDLLKDATITGNHNFTYRADGTQRLGFTLNLNGHTINGNAMLKFGAVRQCDIKGPGTINASIQVFFVCFNAPLTINGNITQSGVSQFKVSGSGVLRVNGNIDRFSLPYDIANGVKVVCSGNYPNDYPISPVKVVEDFNKDLVPKDLKGFKGQALSTVSLPQDWSWVNTETLLSSDTQTYMARFNTTNYEMEYDFTNVDGYNKDQHYVERELIVTVGEAIAKVVKPDGTEVLYSDIVDAFEQAENSTLYLLENVEYDQIADSQLRALVPAKNMILNTNNYTLTCVGFYQYGNLGNPNLTIVGNGKDKVAVNIKDLSGLTTTLSNAKIEVNNIQFGSLYVKSDSSVVAINREDGTKPLIDGSETKLYLEDGADLIGEFRLYSETNTIYMNVQPDKSKYKLEVPNNLELGKTYQLHLSEVFLNHSDIVNKGKIDVSISGMDESGYITMKNGNDIAYLPISIKDIDSLTNDTVILSAEHRNSTDKEQYYNGNGEDSTSITIGDKLIQDVSNPDSQEKLTHGTYTGTLKIKNNIDDTVKEIIVVHEVSHNYKEEWGKNETNHWHECDCGAKSDDATHTFKWVIDKPATHTEIGSKHEECEICGYEKATSVEIPIIGHSFSKDWTNNETNHWRECDCGAKADQDSHTFKWVIDKEATEKEKGSKHEECSVCGYKKTSVEIPVLTPTNPDKPNTDKPNDDKGSVETGDQTNVGLFTSLSMISALSIAVLTVWKKKKALDNK